MTIDLLTDRIVECGLVAIVRADTSVENVVAAIGAVLEGGIRCIEVSMTTPGALDCIEQAARRFEGSPLFLGVGTVTHEEVCYEAIGAGAQYVVSPVIAPPVIDAAHELNKPVLAGAYTPTEIFQARDFGADLVKLFPAGFGGVDYLKTVRAPFPHIPLVPTGGVTVDNMGDFFEAGAVAVGVGNGLVNPALVQAGDLEGLTRNARAFSEALRAARGNES